MKKWAKRVGWFFLAVFALIGFAKVFSTSSVPFGGAVGVVEINGTIWVADETVKEIEKFRKNPRIRAVVVHINSPGGTVGASQEIYSALKALAEKKPVVASMGTLAASGGLYVAMGAKKIFADPGTITGSIGVRMEHVDLAELLKFIKISFQTLKSGEFKDMGSITKPLKPEETALLESLLKEMHVQFKEAVSVSRNIPMSKLNTFADGRIFTGAKAKELGIVDELGDFLQAVKAAGEMGGIKGEPETVYGEKETSWWVKAFLGEARAATAGPLACYLYP